MDERGEALCRGMAALTIASTLWSPTALAEIFYPNVIRGEGSKVIFDVRLDDAALMIIEFAYQSGIEVIYNRRARMKHQVLTPVAGEYDPLEALRLMLSSTNLVMNVTVDGYGTYVVLRPAVVRNPPSAGSGVIDNTLLVTGSHIRNVLDVAAPLMVVNRDEANNAGTASVERAIQQLPPNMGSPLSEHSGGVGNFGRGTALNLRGLGAGATLVLVNGRRQPQAGLLADFVDVSNIPWSIVERIEVLPDGSSAVYGSDAIAGVVNVILRDELDGAESQRRMGASPGGASELLAAQLFGNHWSSGHWLGAYQYSQRTALAASDRAYAATADKRAFGGRDFRSVRANPGNILDPVTLQPRFAIPAGQDGTSLDASELLAGTVNLQNQYADYQLLPDKEAHGVFLTGTQALTHRIKLFGEGRLNRREISWVGFPDLRVLIVPRTNPFLVDPFGGSGFVAVAYNFSKDLGAFRGTGITRNGIGTVGAEVRLQDGWLATLSGTWGRESLLWRSQGHVDLTGQALAAALADSNPSTAFNPFGDGSHTNPSTLNAIQQTRRSEATSTISMASLGADGPLFDLPGGELRAAIGVDARVERLDRTLIGRDFQYRPQHYRRSIAAAFTEFAVPIIGNPSDAKAVPRLQMSLAGRYEDYSDFGHTFNPKIGVQWAPWESFKLRGSWGTSFKAPKLVDLYDVSQNIIGPTFLPDPLSPTGQSVVIFREGSNPDLREETAQAWTVGFDLAPQSKSKFVLTLNAYAIEYRDQVLKPGAATPGGLLTEEGRWSEVITRSPSATLLQTLCTHPDLMGSPSECLALSPAAYIDARLRNIAITRASGLDLDISHSHRSATGLFTFNWSGHYVTSFRQGVSKNSALSNIVDTINNPLRLRLRGMVTWKARADGQGLEIKLSLKHIGSYSNNGSVNRSNVSSDTNADFNICYRAASARRWWSETDFVLSANNVFNHDPPFVDVEQGYDPVNADPLGRTISLYLQKHW